ncbi:hypothetical protein ACFL0L_03420 [Patescibacteria group bacterium]
MERHTVIDSSQLMDIIGAGNPDPGDPGPIMVEVTLWDGRIARATYYKGSNEPDVDSPSTVMTDLSPLNNPVNALLNDGTSFVIRMGQSDDTVVFEWTVEDPGK